MDEAASLEKRLGLIARVTRCAPDGTARAGGRASPRLREAHATGIMRGDSEDSLKIRSPLFSGLRPGSRCPALVPERRDQMANQSQRPHSLLLTKGMTLSKCLGAGGVPEPGQERLVDRRRPSETGA